MTLVGNPTSSAVPVEYRPLHEYLDRRFADVVVLMFTEIEDILGFALPGVARAERTWWVPAAVGEAPSPQSLSWTQANRTASPNLLARKVVFERTSGS